MRPLTTVLSARERWRVGRITCQVDLGQSRHFLTLLLVFPPYLLPSGLPSCQAIITCAVAKDLMDSFYYCPAGSSHVLLVV